MTRFQRLSWDDLGNFSRAELLPRVEAEQKYWQHKEQRGLSEADQHARKEFTKILYAVISPAGLAEAMAETTAWLKGERASDTSYWSEKPGRGRQAAAEAQDSQPEPEPEAGTS